jgi:hypothetical protein
MMYKFGRLVVSLLALLLLLMACSKAEPTPPAVSTATPVVEPTTDAFESPLGTPAATRSAFDSPLPAPARGPSSKDKAAVKGRLVLTNPETIAPQEDGLYLVFVDAENGAPMVLPAVDPETSILAEVDETTGLFFFDNVGEGLYAFVVLTDRGQQLSARDLQTGKSTIVTVGEEHLGTVIDLGRQRLP